MTSILPIRLTQPHEEEMPLDAVGCCSNIMFAWTEKFVGRAAEEATGHGQDEFQLPGTLNCDSVEINAKRLLGKFKEQLQRTGSKLSMFNVLFRFCRTRVLIAILVHIFATLFEVAAIVSSINRSFTIGSFIYQEFILSETRTFIWVIP